MIAADARSHSCCLRAVSYSRALSMAWPGGRGQGERELFVLRA